MKKVYVVCATGIATSTMLRLKIERFLNEHGIQANILQYRVTELSPSRMDADVVVATTGMPPEYEGLVPIVNGLPLITGVGEKEALEQVLNVLTGSTKEE